MGETKSAEILGLVTATFAFYVAARFAFMLTMTLELIPSKAPVDTTYLIIGWVLFAISFVGWAVTIQLCRKK